ncbi:fumarate reductase subunit FrdD [Ramlibacter albus]|uniref:Fumarate reductase subunit D n=1 Tax=Ramlibacter albus TaxID=2079448 RepID=A0A923M8M3_9BURK|nr:fumarate reductase subunit FrdD [Ramlibacter albus]MBC5766020.1 fumarate reductase subunit D [Ramlibacter albus]
MKRSHSPIFWLLFGAGGMLAALLGPALVYVTGVEAGGGLVVSPRAMDYATVHAFAHNWLGKGFLFFVVSLFAWHAVHRILCSLHDVGIHKTLPVKFGCYGVAAAVTAVSAYALLQV